MFFRAIVAGVRLPGGLLKLVFGDNFDQNLEFVIFPGSLQELTFGALRLDVEGFVDVV